MTEKLSDLFHITVDENDIVYDLQPDIKNGHNPKLKEISPIDYWKLYLEEEIKYFCKINNIPLFLWKIFGKIGIRFLHRSACYNFVIRFASKKHEVFFSFNKFSEIRSYSQYRILNKKIDFLL